MAVGEVLKGSVLARDRVFQMLWPILPDEAFRQHVVARDAEARKCLQQQGWRFEDQAAGAHEIRSPDIRSGQIRSEIWQSHMTFSSANVMDALACVTKTSYCSALKESLEQPSQSGRPGGAE